MVVGWLEVGWMSLLPKFSTFNSFACACKGPLVTYNSPHETTKEEITIIIRFEQPLPNGNFFDGLLVGEAATGLLVHLFMDARMVTLNEHLGNQKESIDTIRAELVEMRKENREHNHNMRAEFKADFAHLEDGLKEQISDLKMLLFQNSRK
ncbi:hypothetical protein TWF281_005123 [Arthrobotrys megalospora]